MRTSSNNNTACRYLLLLTILLTNKTRPVTDLFFRLSLTPSPGPPSSNYLRSSFLKNIILSSELVLCLWYLFFEDKAQWIAQVLAGTCQVQILLPMLREQPPHQETQLQLLLCTQKKSLFMTSAYVFPSPIHPIAQLSRFVNKGSHFRERDHSLHRGRLPGSRSSLNHFPRLRFLRLDERRRLRPRISHGFRYELPLLIISHLSHTLFYFPSNSQVKSPPLAYFRLTTLLNSYKHTPLQISLGLAAFKYLFFIYQASS